jgi:hypothetical protein
MVTATSSSSSSESTSATAGAPRELPVLVGPAHGTFDDSTSGSDDNDRLRLGVVWSDVSLAIRAKAGKRTILERCSGTVDPGEVCGEPGCLFLVLVMLFCLILWVFFYVIYEGKGEKVVCKKKSIIKKSQNQCCRVVAIIQAPSSLMTFFFFFFFSLKYIYYVK